MTTQMMAYLASIETSGDVDEHTFYHNDLTQNGIAFDSNTPLSVQIENKTFYTPESLIHTGNGIRCRTDPILLEGRRHYIFSAFMNDGHSLLCGGKIRPQLFTDADRSDWRLVTMVRAEDDEKAADWWNVFAFRGATELKLKSSRTGFFSHPAFLATWRSNEDNDFRVTTNQALIAGLGRAFESSTDANPLGDAGLSDDHASPDTDCYGCHKSLDPMRGFFDVDFDPVHYGTNPKFEGPDYTPNFNFFGHSGEGSDLEDFGRHIAEHPYFSTGWVQKLCAYANTVECDSSDPEFLRIVSAFDDSNLNFKTLVTELFSSSLITNASCANDTLEQSAPISLSRQDHLCPTLAARSGNSNICSANNAIATLVESLPSDFWGRGAETADRATDPGMFYRATVESVCGEISTNIVRFGHSPVATSNIESYLDWLVEGFMGVNRSDPRFSDIRAALKGHHDDIADVNTTNTKRLISLTTLACVSPFITSTDF